MATTAEEIHALIERLPQSDQERVLAYVRELAHKAHRDISLRVLACHPRLATIWRVRWKIPKG